jgi:hypothetical protein
VGRRPERGLTNLTVTRQYDIQKLVWASLGGNFTKIATGRSITVETKRIDANSIKKFE